MNLKKNRLSRKASIVMMAGCLVLTMALIVFCRTPKSIQADILSYTVDPGKQDLQLYWKNDHGEHIRTIQHLISFVKSKKRELVFAMNGGMFNKDLHPQGLFIQNHITLAPIDTNDGSGNFYMKPNGIFYITSDLSPHICKTTDFVFNNKLKYATQSGPMLVINGQIHTSFTKGSTNLNIRNGAGILPGNKVVFAMSKNEISLYDFARYFQELGCKDALYFDGVVSRAYLPEQNWIQTDGPFGVMVGVTTQRE